MANPFTDLFTGAPAKKAAEQQRAFLDQTRTGNNQFIDTGLSTSLANIGQGYNTGAGAVNTGYGDAQGFLTGGADRARAAFDQLSALGGKYGSATTMGLNALGVNGQPGLDTARAAYTPSIGLDFAVDRAVDANDRRMNSRGMLASGNTIDMTGDIAGKLQYDDFNNWRSALLGFTNPELSATSGAATGLAGIEGALGQNQANLATGRGAMLADLAQRYGTQQAGLNTGAANAKVGAANAVVSPYVGSYKQEADASLTGSKNLWGLGMAAAQMAMGMPPTSLGSLGGGGNPSMGGNSNPFMPSGSINPAYLQYG